MRFNLIGISLFLGTQYLRYFRRPRYVTIVLMEAPKVPERQSESVLLDTRDKTKRLTGELAPRNIEGTFTVESYSKFDLNDLGPDDQAYAYTKSGNVYRMAKSESRPGLMKYQEDRMKALQYTGPSPGEERLVVEVGKQMHWVTMNDVNDPTKGGTKMQSSPVKLIEVWRDYIKAHREVEAELIRLAQQAGGLGGLMATGLGNAATGQVRQIDYRKEK